MLTIKELPGTVGTMLFGADQQEIGEVADIYMDQRTLAPEWLVLHTGWFGTRRSFVPTASAEWNGANLVVPFSKAEVKDAPTAEADDFLTAEEEEQLYRHYGLDYHYEDFTQDPIATTMSGTEPAAQQPSAPTAGTDEAMTRSEEQLRVGTRSQEVGRARLRKWIDTEHVTQTVPVSREEVRIVREPVTSENVDQATSGPDLTENVHEVILHEEQAVVSKVTVPVERVRLEKETVTEERPVEADVRKERIEFEENAPPGRPQ